MKFSVVIPLYNKQDSIRRALFSVFDQVGNSAMECEIIVIDDGSSDNSLAITNKIMEENKQHKLIVYSQTNAGVSAARNKGAELASADYVAFLDADDSYAPNFLSTIESLIINFPSAALFATAYRFIDARAGLRSDANLVGLSKGDQQQLLQSFFYSSAYGDLPVTSSSVCIRKSVLESVGKFPQGENMGEDQAVWSQIALRFPIALDQAVCANYFEDTASSLMNTIAPSEEMPFSKRLQQQLDQNEVADDQISSVEHYIAGHLLDLARRNVLAGDSHRANVLLGDSRARRQLKRWAYWSIRSKLSTVLNR